MKKYVWVPVLLLTAVVAGTVFIKENTGVSFGNLYQTAVPAKTLTDYFAERGYRFKENRTICGQMLTVRSLEADRFGGTARFSECGQGLFHSFGLHIYRNLPAERVRESIKDLHRIFLQTAEEPAKAELFLKNCLGGRPGYKGIYSGKDYEGDCSVSAKDYVFFLRAKREHEHPVPKARKKPKCMTRKAYEKAVRKRLYERLEFAGRKEDFYRLYPEKNAGRNILTKDAI